MPRPKALRQFCHNKVHINTIRNAHIEKEGGDLLVAAESKQHLESRQTERLVHFWAANACTLLLLSSHYFSTLSDKPLCSGREMADCERMSEEKEHGTRSSSPTQVLDAHPSPPNTHLHLKLPIHIRASKHRRHRLCATHDGHHHYIESSENTSARSPAAPFRSTSEESGRARS